MGLTDAEIFSCAIGPGFLPGHRKLCLNKRDPGKTSESMLETSSSMPFIAANLEPRSMSLANWPSCRHQCMEQPPTMGLPSLVAECHAPRGSSRVACDGGRPPSAPSMNRIGNVELFIHVLPIGESVRLHARDVGSRMVRWKRISSRGRTRSMHTFRVSSILLLLLIIEPEGMCSG